MEGTKVQYFKSKEYDHFARECPNQRIMVLIEMGTYIVEEDNHLVEKAMSHESNTIRSESDNEINKGMEALVVLRGFNVQPKHEEQKEQRNNIFHMKCWVKTKGCLVIIDGGSCTNVVSELLVSKAQCVVPLKIEELVHEVLCNIIPMTACHVLLGRPWEFDRSTKMVAPIITTCSME